MGSFWQNLITSGTLVSLLAGFWAWLQHRANKKAEASAKKMDGDSEIRKELWSEIGNLRQALREAMATLMEWQSRYLTLIGQQQTANEQIRKLSALLSSALASLDKVEEVERLILKDNDLTGALAELTTMKAEAESLRRRANVIYDIT